MSATVMVGMFRAAAASQVVAGGSCRAAAVRGRPVALAARAAQYAHPYPGAAQPQYRGFFSGMFGKGGGGGKKGPKGDKEAPKPLKPEGETGAAEVEVEVIANNGTAAEAAGGGASGSGSAASGSGSAGGNHLMPRSTEIPSFPSVVAVPLRDRPLFPGGMVPILVQDKSMIETILSLKKRGQPYVGAFLRRPTVTKTTAAPAAAAAAGDGGAASQEVDITAAEMFSGGSGVLTDLAEIHPIGTLASIHTILPMMDGSLQVILYGHRRLRATGVHESEPVLSVEVENIRNPKVPESDAEVVTAYKMEVVSTLKELLQANPVFREQVQMFQALEGLQDPAKLADFVAHIISAEGRELQGVLDCVDVTERLAKVLTLLKKEVRVSKLQEEIKQQVEEKMTKQQRRFMLMEQLKAIKKELGMEKDDKETIIAEFRDRMSKKTIPDPVLKVIEEELNKLATIEGASSEFNVTKSYLDWLTVLPWGTYSEETFDVVRAEQVLNADHYGLDDVKERILEFVAVGKLRGSVQGKILCLVGPPGVGKTSIGRSIAKALGREYYRFSVGGLTDVAEIKGHRRTYVGAMPGKLMQCLKTTGTQNPMVLIDEIDKLGRSHQGDPASALLELLDPSQNSTFRDHYMDVPVDLSKVLFVCTANTLDTIPGPLLDRMEVTQIAGYIAEEKVSIARQYLEPRIQVDTGIPAERLTIGDEALAALIESYCREAGVRNLNKKLEQIYRKAALKLVRNPDTPVHVATAKDLHEFVGNPVFSSDRLFENPPPGVTMGLAWTSMGGSALYIEASLADRLPEGDKGGRGSLMVTGKLGEVMRESTSIAHTYSKHFCQAKGLTKASDFLHKASLHLHVPEGATPKDGPSAGVTLTTSIISLAMGVPVRENVAMTGELTLTGKVLPIGGVKEKTLAAKRAGVQVILFPKANQKDFEDLPASLKAGLEAHFVSNYEDVYNVCFGHVVPDSESKIGA